MNPRALLLFVAPAVLLSCLGLSYAFFTGHVPWILIFLLLGNIVVIIKIPNRYFRASNSDDALKRKLREMMK